MKTITVLGRQFGLSRTTLLYYDRIGLLSPSYRTTADARLYSTEDEKRLARIVTFRRAGIPLESIRHMLDAAPARVNGTLETHLRCIQDQIGQLRSQQRLIVEMLKQAVLRGERPQRTRDQWVALLQACAFTEADMRSWHVEMERENPRGHLRFLRRIGLSRMEIERVRAQSQASPAAADHSRPNASAAKP